MSGDPNNISLSDLLGQSSDSKLNLFQNQNDVSNISFPNGFSPEILAQILNATTDPTFTTSSEPVNRGSWSQEEDLALINAINQLGETKWVEISKCIGTRSPKQARERWTNCLKPGLKKGPFEPYEDDIILQKHQEFGNKWAIIARFLAGRSAGAVKNRWYTHLKNFKTMNSNMNFDMNIPQMDTSIQIPRDFDPS